MNPRVYRLVVEVPEESWEPGWMPEGWGHQPWTPEEERTTFQWPRTRDYLSRSGAEKRADLFRKYGATVRVVASAPVEFPDMFTEVAS